MPNDLITSSVTMALVSQKWEIIESKPKYFLIEKARRRAEITITDNAVILANIKGERDVSSWLKPLGSRISMELEKRKVADVVSGEAFKPSKTPVMRCKVPAGHTRQSVRSAVLRVFQGAGETVAVARNSSVSGAVYDAMAHTSYGNGWDNTRASAVAGASNSGENRAFNEMKPISTWDVESVDESVIRIVSGKSTAEIRITDTNLEIIQTGGIVDMKESLRKVGTRIVLSLENTSRP